MAILSATFEAIDKMSDKFDKMASSGERAFDQWERAGEVGNETFEQTAKAATQTATAMETASQSTDHWTDKLGYYDKSAMEAIYSTEELVEMGYKTADALEDAAGGAEEFGNESEEAGRKAEEFGNKSTDAMQSLEDALVTLGVVKLLEQIGDAFVSCIEDAIEFESAITGVFKTVNGTEEQLAEITDQTKELALRIPATTTEIAGVAEAAGQLGIATEDIMSFTEVMINLGEATNLSSDEAASSLAKFANITQMNSQEYENLGSTVVALGNNFATTEADIVAMSMRMASAGTLAGMTESDILALAASMSSVGIEADAGGSSMSTLLSRIQLAVETGTEELEQYASVANMSAEQFKQSWGEDAVGALYAFISGLNDTERNGASATAILDEMGITEIRLTNAVKSLASNHEGLAEAVNLAGNAWEENTALATEANTRYATLESRLDMTKNAANNLSIAVGDVFAPAVEDGADAAASLLNGLTGFVEEHPGVVKALAVVTAGLAAYTAGVTAYVAAKKIATIVQRNFNAAALANPYVLLATGIAAVATAVVLFTEDMDAAEKEMAALTATSRKEANELKSLESQYDSICEQYGENSYEAQELKWRIDDLSESYQNNKKTAEEYNEELNNYITALREADEAYENSTQEIDNQSESSMALIQQLQTLSSTSEMAARNQALIVPIIDELNSRYEGLGLTFDSLTGKFNKEPADIQAIAQAEADAQAAEEAWKEYVRIIGEAPTALKKLEEAQGELNNRTNEYKSYQDQLDGYWTKNWWKAFLGYTEEYTDIGIAAVGAKEAMEEQQTAVNNLQAEYDNMISRQRELEEQFGYVSESSESVDSALGYISTQIQNLAKAYDDAYQSALTSFQGQFSLFDQAETDAQATVANMQKAMDSQVAFWENYASNIDVLKSKSATDLGLTQEQYSALLAYVQDGSEQAAGFAESLVNNIESGNVQAVTKLGETVTKLQEAEEKAATSVANLQVDVDGKMQELTTKMQEAMTKLNMSEDAIAAATSTMEAYTTNITTKGGEAVIAAQGIADKIKAALESGSATITVKVRQVGEDPTGTGYATGTDFATPGWHLVGEEGPEIVEFAGGETVYPADETARMLASMRPTPLNTNVPESLTGQKTEDVVTKDKRIVVAIEGGGEISVKGDVSKETVVELLVSNLKPVLLNMIQEEVFEEGDGSYEY